jgi:uncharacterized protein (TIGR03067 family)
MRLCGWMLAVTVLSAGSAQAQNVDIAQEIKKLEGQWLVAHRAYTPSKANAAVTKILMDLGTKVEIQDGKISAGDADKDGYHLDADFDPTSKPKNLDLTVPGEKKRVLLGIYFLEDDVLSIAVGTKDVRPKSFAITNDRVLLILKKARKQPN